MGILSRFKDIMSSNINALLDKAEDPAKMVDQIMRNLEKDLSKVKSETAAVMAEAACAEREYNECVSNIDKYKSYAEKSVKMGDDEKARRFLTEKNKEASKLEGLKQSMETACAQKSPAHYKIRRRGI